MEEGTETLAERKNGDRDVYHPNNPGTWCDSPKVRGVSDNHYTNDFEECVVFQAQYIHNIYGNFPATVPSIFDLTYVQAQHIELDFYDNYFKPDTYVTTQKEHMKRWQ